MFELILFLFSQTNFQLLKDGLNRETPDPNLANNYNYNFNCI